MRTKIVGAHQSPRLHMMFSYLCNFKRRRGRVADDHLRMCLQDAIVNISSQIQS